LILKNLKNLFVATYRAPTVLQVKDYIFLARKVGRNKYIWLSPNYYLFQFISIYVLLTIPAEIYASKKLKESVSRAPDDDKFIAYA
jgi:hypothetical protein